MRGIAERFAQRGERFRLAIVAVDVAQELREARKGRFVDAVLACLEAVANPLAQVLDARAAACHADDGDIEDPMADEALQRGKNLLVREVAGDAKYD